VAADRRSFAAVGAFLAEIREPRPEFGAPERSIAQLVRIVGSCLALVARSAISSPRRRCYGQEWL
jgi:hypothetical protein